MRTSYGDKFGKNVMSRLTSSGLWFPQHRLVLPLAVLTGLGLGIRTVISSYLRLKKKEARGDDGYTEEDLISAMPDDILCSILSRLDTKDVVRTSILCRRWSNLYLFLPYYSFSCRCSFKIPFIGQCSCTPEYKKEFLTVLDRFFRTPRGAGCEKIKSFSLSLCVKRDFKCHIERWVRLIAGLGVEELALRLCCQRGTEHITFPLQKLLCEAATTPMLKSLQLVACILEPFHPQRPFKSLTSLRLGCIKSVDVQGILSSCPELESLTLEFCCLPSKVFIGGGKQLKLKSLTINRCYGGIKEISLCAENLVILEVESRLDSKLKFSHPTNAPKLQHFSITVMHFSDTLDIISWLGKDCPQVESLYLDFWLGNLPWAYILPDEVPTFGRMRQLYILMEFNELFDVIQIAALITACPLLQRLHLVGRGRKVQCFFSRKRVSLENHLHLHLREVEFGGFVGLENEVALVLYILKSALALERMVLCRDYRWYTGACGGGGWEERKDYRGPTWSENPPYTVTFDHNKLQTIHQQLRGQTASPTVQVIVI